MSATEFFDSNVLIYLISNDRAKAAAAVSLLATGGTVSLQVLNEVAHVAQRKLGRTMTEIRAALAGIRAVCAVIAPDIATHEAGLDIAERYKFSIHDSMLLAAAQRANCTTFFSEDMQHGQKIGGLTIKNPFRP